MANLALSFRPMWTETMSYQRRFVVHTKTCLEMRRIYWVRLGISISSILVRNNMASFSENGVLLFIWIGGAIAPEWTHDVFGVQNFGQINADKVSWGWCVGGDPIEGCKVSRVSLL